jgi:hypothetical protein
LSGDSGEVLFDEAPMDADNSYGIALNDVSGAVYSSSSCALKNGDQKRFYSISAEHACSG